MLDPASPSWLSDVLSAAEAVNQTSPPFPVLPPWLPRPPTPTPKRRAPGVAFVTVAAGFSLYALVYSLGTGKPWSFAAGAVAILLAASAAAMWRLGPRRVEPLVIGLALCGVGLLQMQSPLLAVAPTLLAGAVAVRRVAVGNVAHSD